MGDAAQLAKNLVNGKLIATIGGPENSDFNDLVFRFSNALVVSAGTNLPAFVTKTTINHLSTLQERQTFKPTLSHMGEAVNATLPAMHPECILELVNALDLQVSKE